MGYFTKIVLNTGLNTHRVHRLADGRYELRPVLDIALDEAEAIFQMLADFALKYRDHDYAINLTAPAETRPDWIGLVVIKPFPSS